jgi:hypothetical protein
MQLDCNACKSPSSMVATKVARFSGVIRAIGIILFIPSFLGFAIAALFFISSVMATANVMPTTHSEAEQAGAAIGFVIGFGFSIFVGVISLVGGLLGWLLLSNRKVYRCVRCGSIIERA